MRDCLRIFIVMGLLGALLSASASADAQQSTARLTCRFEPASIPAGQTAHLVIELADVQSLYGYELNMTYDSSKAQVQDGDAAKDGINLQLGAFLSPDFVLFNTVGNGSFQLALTQLAPAAAKSGSGELARATVQGTAEGFANFAFGDVTFSDTSGNVIAVAKQDCLLEIGAAGQPTPTATPIPTDKPATNTSTAIPTATHTPANAQTPTNTPVSTNTPTTVAAPTQTPVPPTPVPQPQTPTWTPTATSSATPLPTASPMPTPTVLMFSAPTPNENPVQAAGVVQEDAVAQSPDITPASDSIPTVTETVQPANQESTPVPTIVTNPAVATGAEVETNRVNTPSAEAVVLLEPSPTATSTATPMKIAQIGQATPLPIEAIQQPPTSASPAKPGFVRGLGWLFLFVTSVLTAVIWWMRKG